MIETVYIQSLEDKAESIYEVAIVLAKRARQINDVQKQILTKERESFEEEYEGFSEDDPFTPIPKTDFLVLPKPSDVALEEFFGGKLDYYYRKTSDSPEDTED